MSVLAAWNASSSIRGQTPAPPAKTPASTPVSPPSDPFVRDPQGAQPRASAGAIDPRSLPVNLLAVLETWSLNQNDFLTLLEGSANERAPYDRLEELAKAGKAKLVNLMALSCKSGNRAVTESIDELRYPTEFDPAGKAGEISFPTAWETRNTGDTLEIETVLGPDGKGIDVNLVPQTVRFDGFRDWQAEAAAAPVGQPQFRTEKVTTSMPLQSGRPAILTTATPAAADGPGDGQIRIRALRITAQPASPANATPNEVIGARVEFLLYSVERETARRILTECADSEKSHAAVRALVEKDGAQVEIVSAFVTKSGQRGVNEEIFEFRYPSVTSPPSYGLPTARKPASPTAFETRNTGVTVEIEPVFGPDARFVDINVVPQVVRFAGMHMANGVAAKYPPSPVFTTRKVTTSVSSGAGVPVLLGTMSQPRDTGVNDRKDDGRTSLAYIRVTPVPP